MEESRRAAETVPAGSPDRPDGAGVAGERHPGRWLTFAASIVLVIAVLYVGRGVLIPLAIAILLTFLLSPIVTRLQRLGLPRIPAVLATAAAAFLVIGALGLLIGVQATQLATELPAYQSNIVAKLRGLREAAPSGGVFERLSEMVETLRAELAAATPAPPPSDAPEIPIVQVQQPPLSAFNVIAELAGPLLGPVGKSGLVIVLVIFMLLEREELRNRLIRLLGPNLNVTTEALDEAGYRVSRYLLMQLVVNLTYGVPLGIGLYFIGIPNAFLWAVLAIVLRFIPYLGPVLSATFPLLLAVAVDPGWTMLLLTLALILTLELISNNFIEPWLYGVSTSISAVAIIVAAIFWTTLWGPIGLLLATPLTVCLAVSGRYFPQLAFLDVLLSSAPALSLQERLYQRLLAGDANEGVAIAETYLDEHELEELYDHVALPALRLAAADDARGALTEERRLVVIRSILEVIDELSDYDERGQHAERKGAAGSESDEARPSVLCAAGSSGLDLALAAMLGQLLERRGFATRITSAEALAPRHLSASRLADVDAVCLSYLDETALPRAQHGARRLARYFPGKPAVLGLWGLPEEQRRRLARLPAEVRAVSTLQEALEAVDELVPSPSRQYAAAPISADEEERLQDLRALHALDASDTRLRHYTRMLSEAFHVPIALVNLIDEDSQHFKGQVGLPDELVTAGSSPRETSICGHVVAENDLLVIEDALKDPRFAKNPFLLKYGIRFYAGIPLRSRRGHALGSLCVIDAAPRTVSEEEKALLGRVAEEAMAELERLAEAVEAPRA
jgi:predicted PurR-regulated permease PerM